MSDQSKMKKLVIHKDNLEYEVGRLERKVSNEKSRIELLQERIEKEKLKIKALEEQIEKEKGSSVPESVPEVYDPKSYIEAGRWNDASYGIPDLINGSGYKGRVLCPWDTMRGSLPRPSVWECDHPAAKRWCRNTLTDKRDALKKEILKIERIHAKYID